MPKGSNNNSWPHQEFHDANRSKNEASRSSQVSWDSKKYHYCGTNIQVTQKEGRGVLKQPGSSISAVRADQNGTVHDNAYRQY